eukprot:g261.t1
MESTVISLSVQDTWNTLIQANVFATFANDNSSSHKVELLEAKTKKASTSVLTDGSSWNVSSEGLVVKVTLDASAFALSWTEVKSGKSDTIRLKSITDSDETFLTWSSSDVSTAKTRNRCLATASDNLRGHFWTMANVRQAFIDFFTKKKGHTFYRSSPTVPRDDPTLLFANAGMNQFKPIFMGQVPKGSPMEGMKRAANSQKCIRAGGKHNDLEDVGFDVYHHTYFEMLGNWSFGDYFKKEAIAWAWELLTKVYKLRTDRLYVTYFGGDEKMGLQPDLEARDIWLKYLPAERILPFDKKDNFWEMGATGPCGPCTEIHYDRVGGPASARGPIVNADDPNLLEIWNLVFMQFNRLVDGSLQNLPAASVDTGMGFERLTSVLQNKESNYDTDIFAPIFRKIESLAGKGVRPYNGLVGAEDVGRVDMAYRVIADHIRTLTFSITDGAVPGAQGRNYVVRRVLRRAVRFGQQQLQMRPGFMCELVDVVVQHFKSAFPEIEKRQAYVTGIIRQEEDTFNRTVLKGIREFKKSVRGFKVGDQLSAGAAYRLWSTFGFPRELVELMLDEENLKMCADADWDTEKERQQTISRQGMKDAVASGMKLEANETTALESKMGVSSTASEYKYEWHEKGRVRATIKALFLGQKQGFVDSVDGSSASVGVVLDKTAFYYTSGGQCSDTGALFSVATTGSSKSSKETENDDDETSVFDVSVCELYGKYVLHVGKVPGGAKLSVGDVVECRVDYERRMKIAPNHTMTHVLNFALRKVLDPKTDQKGSLVDDEKLRFDFNAKGALSAEQLAAVEKIVNQNIKSALKVHTSVLPFAKAKEIEGLRMCAEDYPEHVRVVSVGVDAQSVLKDPSNAKWSEFSLELCGGTHLQDSSEAQAFYILKEESIQEGVRRIVAVTREKAVQARVELNALESKFDEASAVPAGQREAILKTLLLQLDAATIPASGKRRLRKVHAAMTKELSELSKKRQKEKQVDAKKAFESAVEEADKAGRKYVVVAPLRLGVKDAKVASTVLKKPLKKRKDLSVILIGSDPPAEGVLCVAVVSKAHQKDGLKANEWVECALAVCGKNRCGGREGQAQGTGKDASKAVAAARAAEEFAKKHSA